MSKYYAVSNGRQTGIFRTWDETKVLVDGYSGAKYKSFKTLKEAQTYLNIPEENTDVQTDPVLLPTTTTTNTTTTNTTITNTTTTNTIQTIPTGVILPPPTFVQNDIPIIYTDGSCIDKVGGYGIVILYQNKEYQYSYKGKVPFYPTTNQVAELYAIYAAIHYVETYKTVTIYTDSKYSIGCLTLWCKTWQTNGWLNAKGEAVANQELIKSILMLSKNMNITYIHVRAHNGDKYNEMADQLADQGRLL